MQMLSEIGIDNNTTTVIMLPSDFSAAAKSFTQMVANQSAPTQPSAPSV
jgi:hypothetical protein